MEELATTRSPADNSEPGLRLTRAVFDALCEQDLRASTVRCTTGLDMFGYPPEEVGTEGSRWTERIHRRGFIAVVLGRLIPGARVVMSLVAGTAKVPLYQFSPAVFVAACVYWTFWVTIGAALGPMFRRFAGPYITYVLIALPLVVIAFFVYRHLQARRKWASRPTPRI